MQQPIGHVQLQGHNFWCCRSFSSASKKFIGWSVKCNINLSVTLLIEVALLFLPSSHPHTHDIAAQPNSGESLVGFIEL